MATAPTPENFRDYIEQISPDWLLGELSAGFIGVIFSYTADALANAMSAAAKMPWLKEPTSPNDVLPLVGAERRLPRYPIDTDETYRNRLWLAWDTYEFGGDENTIIGELANTGIVGAQVFDPWNATFDPVGYWSHFIVFFPIGSHPVTAAGPAWGSWNWGDGTIWGPVGLTVELAATIRGIIAKWKPVRWICRKIVFQISGWAWGTGHTWGEGGLAWGGDTVEIGP